MALVLGSGGARGLAHIGVIRWLESHNYHIQSISGSSIGALIGGAHAAGKLDELEAWFKSLTQSDIFSLADIAWMRTGLIKGNRLFDTLKEIIGDPNIEDLPIPFTAVASDIENEKEVWLERGSLLTAIRASTALPMIFTPSQIDGLTLVDGGVLNPIPIAPTFRQTPDLTVAVNLGGKPKTARAVPSLPASALLPGLVKSSNNAHSATNVFKRRLKSVLKYLHLSILGKLFLTDSTLKSSLKNPSYWDVYEISSRAFDSMQNSLARQKLADYPPDRLIEISRDACGMLEFTKVHEMIALGYQAAETALNPTQ
ncbi:patatin-like phospholipase family protein [Thiomicrorhabdus aquaedulcis]|uniref:patatin-like phospholipase family protein n=1 Tax=Thiomicrorhabdus aquaedulcis TaxID=2211106 RepID=UPI00156266A9|nr:patatin-like phospholipase family protein [Thiomicrorhabdus aquaedulcis]